MLNRKKLVRKNDGKTYEIDEALFKQIVDSFPEIDLDVLQVQVNADKHMERGLKKLNWCQQAVYDFKAHDRYFGVKPSKVCDTLDWLYRWYPEFREEVEDLADEMSEMFENNIFDCYAPWQL